MSDGQCIDGLDEQGGDAACWAHLVCPECGRVVDDRAPHDCEAAPANGDGSDDT